MGMKLTLQYFTDSGPGISVLYLFAAVLVDSIGVCWRKWRHTKQRWRGVNNLAPPPDWYAERFN